MKPRFEDHFLNRISYGLAKNWASYSFWVIYCQLAGIVQYQQKRCGIGVYWATAVFARSSVVAVKLMWSIVYSKWVASWSRIAMYCSVCSKSDEFYSQIAERMNDRELTCAWLVTGRPAQATDRVCLDTGEKDSLRNLTWGQSSNILANEQSWIVTTPSISGLTSSRKLVGALRCKIGPFLRVWTFFSRI